MRKRAVVTPGGIIALTSFGIAMVALVQGCAINAASGHDVAAKRTGFAVVELFTSEGCSSCPPADDVLAKVVADARKERSNVFAIAYHVDYWNRLGWADRFSTKTATERQEAYTRAFRRDGAYTPQMVVNGRVEFVGSDAARATAEIQSAIKTDAVVSIELTVRVHDGRTLAFDYRVSGAPTGATLNVVLVEHGLTTKVARGENGGKLLHHENVARASVKLDLAQPDGMGTVAAPEDVDLHATSVIAFGQADRTMEIVAATGVDLVGK